MRTLFNSACLAASMTLSSLTAGAANAQSFEDVMARAQAAVGDIAKYQQALQNPDLRLQYSLVQEMLKHSDPAIQRLAKEHALFSTNPVMREAAIKAILDSGAMLRLQIASATEGPYEKVGHWTVSNGGTFDRNRGEIILTVPAAHSDSCWGSESHCVLRQVGATLQLNPYYPGNYTNQITSTMNLGNDGILRGTISHKGAEIMQIQIDLKE